MPSYEYECLRDACRRLTVYVLRDDQDMKPHLACCEWCGAKSRELRLSAYYRKADDLIAALQDQIESLERRVNELETDAEPQHDDSVKQ